MKKLSIFLFFYFLSYFPRLSRYDKVCVKVYIKIDKIYDNIYNGLPRFFYFLRLSRYSETCVKIYVKPCVKIYKFTIMFAMDIIIIIK